MPRPAGLELLCPVSNFFPQTLRNPAAILAGFVGLIKLLGRLQEVGSSQRYRRHLLAGPLAEASLVL